MATASTDQMPKKCRSDFVFIRKIGEGSFSVVHLAEEKKTQMKFAIKECDKYQILKEKKVKYVHLEKRILSEYLTNHPFIIKLCFTFQDDSSLYFGLSYCPNGDLLDFMKKYEDGFKHNGLTCFYTAEIATAIEFMHSKNVIHRDIKPENILLDERRHIKLSDFGTARILDEENVDGEKLKELETRVQRMSLMTGENEQKKDVDKLKRRNSFVGTAQYVSPEILQGKDVHKGCDLWALGCIVYQMFTGKHCFTGPHEYDIYQKIIRVSYEMNDNIPSKAQQLINKLIQFEPSKRLGVVEMGGFQVLKENEFFEDIKDWLNLNDQEPPLPQIRLLKYTNAQPHWNLLLNLSTHDREYLMKKQKTENIYHKFVSDYLILKQGFLLKRKDLRRMRRRMFILTEGPQCVYIDSDSMVLKGSVDWSNAINCEIVNFKVFFIHTPKRKYHLIDQDSKALEWTRAIMDITRFYFS